MAQQGTSPMDTVENDNECITQLTVYGTTKYETYGYC